ncbi:MAG: superinfection immunity protein [Rhizobiales bacterium]|nr:superinfection immunity protein [Hyphomicrobiales bacterium]MCW5684533.1 superinfection immunity protein [Pseudolabrys sp.]OJY41861.1 MAG: hypothetical protein BGP08_10960 [Rhizobiales bacterium 64-17]
MIRSDMGFLFVAVFYLGLAIIYVIPSIVAFRRNHPNRWIIAVINMAFGGTIIGWGVALVWALRAVHRPGSTDSGGESGLNIFVNDTKKVQIVDPSSASTAQELERLHDLLTRGVISQTEFDGLKTKLIGV